MSGYDAPSSPVRPSFSSSRSYNRPSSSRRSSFSLPGLLRPASQANVVLPDPLEMEAAFDDPSDDEVDGDRRGLLAGRGVDERKDNERFRITDESDDDDEKTAAVAEIRGALDPLRSTTAENSRMPGDYDFDRTDFPLPIPSESPPPFQPYSRHNPAQGNSNGIIPTMAPSIPSRHAGGTLIGSLLPSYVQRVLRVGPEGRPGAGHDGVPVGGGMSGVFANLAARPDMGPRPPAPGEVEGPEWVPEDAQKDGPPPYQVAARDVVPPYWETTVVLPSSSSPFGTLTSSIAGDEIMIDGMPVGNLFAFAWNLLVSMSFQFIGFLLTYVLHTTHAAKYGSRAGLGITLIQYGMYLRGRAEEMIETGKFPNDPSDPLPTDGTGVGADDDGADDGLGLGNNGNNGFWPPGWRTIEHQAGSGITIPAFANYDEAHAWSVSHNVTMSEILGLPSAADIGQANEWLSFIMMVLGWFLLLTSLGSYWRVKRFERGLRASQSVSEDPTEELGNGSARRRGGVADIFGQAYNRVEEVVDRARQRLSSRPVFTRGNQGGPGGGSGGRSESTATDGDAGAVFVFHADSDVDEDIAGEYPGEVVRRGDAQLRG